MYQSLQAVVQVPSWPLEGLARVSEITGTLQVWQECRRGINLGFV